MSLSTIAERLVFIICDVTIAERLVSIICDVLCTETDAHTHALQSLLCVSKHITFM